MRDWFLFEKPNGISSFLLPIVIGLTAVVVSACDSGGAGPEPGNDEPIISGETLVVDSSEANLQQIRGDTLSFQLSGSAPEFEAGDIVVGQEDGGFLRRVSSVDTEGSKATLITEQASLVEAIERGEVSKSFDLSGAQRKKSGKGALEELEWEAVHTVKGVEPKANTLGIELTNAEITEGDQAAMEVIFKDGEAGYDPSVDFDLEIADGEVDRLRIAASGTANFSTDVEVAATNTIEAENKKSLARFRTSPIVFFIGPVPVTVQPVVDFFAGYEAQIQQTGSIQTGIESSNTVTFGAEYADGTWNPVAEREKSIDPRPFDWSVELSGETKGYVRPELTLKVYQVAGPLINTGPYVRADAIVRPDSWEWGLYGGLDASFGGKVEIFSFELARYDHTFSLAEAEIATDSGERKATISGTITNQETSTAIEGATVTGTAVKSGEELFSTTTDSSGEYETTFSADPEPDEISVTAQAKDYESGEVRISFSEDMEADLMLTPKPEDGVTEGLQVYYPFSGDALDESGNGNHGSVYDATLTTGRKGGKEEAYDFNGESSYIDVPDEAVETDQGTISLWFLGRSAKDGDRLFSMSNFPSPAGTRLYITLQEEETVRTTFIYDPVGEVDIQFGEWYHVAFTWDSEEAKFYVNGDLEATADGGTPTNGRVTLGSYGESFDKHFLDGKLDDVRIYNRVLSKDEVISLYEE